MLDLELNYHYNQYMIYGLLLLALALSVFLFWPKSGWHIGPTINGRNLSRGMPSRPTKLGSGWYFDFPTDPNSHVHYVQNFSAAPRNGVRITFRVEGEADFIPQEAPHLQAIISIQLQRKGDNWSGRDKYNYYRVFSQPIPLTPGTHTLDAPFNGKWIAVHGSAMDYDVLLAAEHLDNVGILFGSSGGYGHGVYATAPARFILESYEEY